MEKPTRGRASKVDLLPPNIKTQLAMMLRDKQYSQSEILEEINDIIRDCGLDESLLLSRSGLNRYASRMEKMASKIRQAREVAEVWTKQFGEEPKDDIGKLLIEFVKQMAFNTTLKLGESDDVVDPEVLNQLAMVTHRIEQANTISFKREQAIREETIKQAAKVVEETARQNGNKQEDVLKMVQAVYGIGNK